MANYTRDTMFIGGQWVKTRSPERIEVISPFTEQVIATVPAASKGEVDDAVAAARHAFDHGPWPKLPVEERIKAIERLRAVFERRKEEMAQTITDEMGSPITQSRTIQTTVPLMMMDEHSLLARNTVKWTELRQSRSGKKMRLREF